MAVEAKRKAKIELTAGTAGMDRGLSDAKRKLRAFEREQAKADRQAKSDADKAAKRAQRARNAFASSIMKGVGMAIGGDIVSQAKSAIGGVRDFERELTRFQIDAQLSGSQVSAFRDQVMETSKATGQSRLEILKGAHAYQILTGDARSAIQVSKLFAEVANASGASMDDIAATAASLHNNLGFGSKDFQQGFDILLSMGHKANIELRQFGAEMNRLTPLFRGFGNAPEMDKLAELAASFEVIGPSFKGPEEAAEGFQQAMMQISKPQVAQRFADLGVKIWTVDPKTKRHVERDWLDIIKDIRDKVPDKMVLQAAVGGRVNAYLAIKAMVDSYERLVQLKQEALGSDQVAKDNATYLASATGRLDIAMNALKVTVAQIFTPERIESWTSAITKALDAASAFIGAMNWLSGGGGGDGKDADRAATDFVEDAHRAPKRGILQRGLAGTDETQAGVEQQAIDAALGVIQNPNSPAVQLASKRYGGMAAYQAGARKFLESEGYLFDKSGKLRSGMGADADPFAVLDDAMKRLPTAADMRDAFAGALKDAGLSRNGNTRDPGPQVNVKIGAEPVQKAAANSIEHRRGRQH